MRQRISLEISLLFCEESFTVVYVTTLSIPEADVYGAKELEILELLSLDINVDFLQTEVLCHHKLKAFWS